jgi:hypothetical protein
MNAIEKRLSELILTPGKYSEVDLHLIKNALCFIRDSERTDIVAATEAFIAELVHSRENNIPFDEQAEKEKLFKKFEDEY